jgi:hypothetical protein
MRTPRPRTILAHGHIFKNAGSTLDWALKRNFGRRFVDHRDDQPMRTEGTAYLGKYLNANPKLIAISSHHLCYPLPEIDQVTIVPVYILRNPIERVLSVYEFERRQPSSTPGAVNAKRWDIDEYVRWRLQPDSGATIRNYQVRYLTGMHRFPKRRVSNEVYQAALENLQSAVSRIGIVEKLDESFVEFEHALRHHQPFATLDLAYVSQNVNTSRPATSGERIDELRVRLGDSLFDELMAANEFDNRLHAEADRLLAERCQEIDDFDEHLNEFRARRENLSR